MKDTIRSTNEVTGDEAAPVPEELPAAQRTIALLRLKGRLGDFIAQMTAAGALIVVFIFLSFASPDFLTTNNLINIIEQNAVTAVIALGMTFVIITAGIVVGLGNGLLISVARLNPFIATLGMMTVVRGLTDVATNAVVVEGPSDVLGPDNFGVIGLGQVAGIPVALIILVVLSVLAYLLLSHTRLGRYTYAIGSNQEAARLSGIPVKRYLLAVYVILGLLTGLAGMIAVSRLGIGEPNFGIGLELDVIAATVIGGASLFGGQGTILGTLLGVFLIGLIRDGSVLLDVNLFTQNVIIGIVIWLAVLWDQFRRRRISSLAS